MSKRSSVSVDSPRREEAARWESLQEAASFAAKETNEGLERANISSRIQPRGIGGPGVNDQLGRRRLCGGPAAIAATDRRCGSRRSIPRREGVGLIGICTLNRTGYRPREEGSDWPLWVNRNCRSEWVY